jgi:hypothetical protein
MRPSRKWFAAEIIDMPTTTASVSLITRSGVLYGWSFKETTGSAAASLALVDGTAENTQGIVSINLLANESTRDLGGQPGIWVNSGVYCHVLSGSVSGKIYFQALSDDEILAILDRGNG